MAANFALVKVVYIYMYVCMYLFIHTTRGQEPPHRESANVPIHSDFPRSYQQSRALGFYAIAMMLPMHQCYGGKMGEAFHVTGSSAAEFIDPNR